VPSIDHLTGDVGASARRPMAAGHVIVVGVVALLVGALLNAPGIRKTALGQPVGWRRDLATAFANPLYDLSHALHADRLREDLKDLLGRSSDDTVNSRLPSPTTAPPGPTPTTLPPRLGYSPFHPLRLWLGGDSLADTPGSSLIDQLSTNRAVGIIGPVDTHISTGLARPEVFNWPAYLKTIVTNDQPNAVVLTFGANDDQTLTGDGGGEPFGSPAWQNEYRRRIGGLMDAVTSTGTHPRLFFVGIPPVKDTARFTDRYVLINNIVNSEAKARPGRVYYVDTVSALGTTTGGYTDYLANPDGTVVLVRTADGVHFTRAGGDRIAAKVLDAFHQAFDLDSWRTARSPTTTTTKGSHPTKTPTRPTTTTTQRP
jgi:lysophospholipase L1-like esterase